MFIALKMVKMRSFSEDVVLLRIVLCSSEELLGFLADLSSSGLHLCFFVGRIFTGFFVRLLACC